MARTASPDEIEPLREMCRKGQLFEVREWVRQGSPLAVSVLPPPRNARHGALRIALDRGFHSLVQVLLEAGAPIREGRYCALTHAVQLRRSDLAALLIQHGARVEDVSMHDVVGSWQAEMVELFVSHGASLVRGNPLAWGLINKMRPALGLLKRHVASQPELLRQADIALRHHAAEGNLKWVSLMLWVGADPWTRGPDEVPDWEPSEQDEEVDDYHSSAVERAVTRGRLEVLESKEMLTPPDRERSETLTLLENVGTVRDSRVLALLLARGHHPKLLPDRCSRLLTQLLCGMSSDDFGPRLPQLQTGKIRGLDTHRAREQLKMIRLLLEHGARWLPVDRQEIRYVRQSLLRMAPSFLIEFVNLVQQHKASRRQDINELVRTAAMTEMLASKSRQLAKLIAKVPEEVSDDFR